jgi:REP element-mobilizing transposase RayT
MNSNLIEGTKIKSVSSLMGALKTTSSKLIHEEGFLDFEWHRSFHDHIIKDDKAYNTIFNYIITNPANWGKDKFYSKN